MLQKGAKFVLDELSAHVCSISAVDDRVSSLNQLHVQDINSISSSPIDDFCYIENLIDHEVERYSFRYEDE